ncbi:hypothetical protein SAMN05216389_101272 [Oceanobacillus limi]|uniref:Uncharacterized protein n=1 Tax=Oceanobacillus limi TaxID=930131 RepID=A0A1H9YAW5_9BACI|nr:hypothetical protein [Oceanobacillus limi]SES65568.1 hypothetical protein SAMN05216389_101272 [Oceanobacillus limi]
MKKYETLLDQREINILENMVGKKLESLLSKSLNGMIPEPIYQFYQPIVLGFDKHYVTVDVEYMETLEGWDDYWDFSLQEQETPEPINYRGDSKSNNMMLYQPLVFLGVWSEIKGFSVYTLDSHTETEHIHSDVAIVLYLENETKLCISGRTDWSALQLTWDENKISKIIDEDCYERYVGGSK